MFKDNKYRRIYCSIIDRAVSAGRKKGRGTYYESHHVAPACVTGMKRSAGRRVLLTAKEHFICHLLLIKFVHNDFVTKAQWALHSMANHNSQRNGLTAAQFEKARVEFAKAQVGEKNPFFGMKHTEEFKKKTSEHFKRINKGRVPWNKGVPITEEQRTKQRAAMMGKPAWNKGMHK